MKAALCALFGGTLFYLSQGTADLWWLAWLAATPFLWLACGPGRWWATSLATFIGYVLGEIYLFQCYAKFPLVVIAGQAILIALLFTAAVVFSQAAYRRIGPLAALVAFPAGWTALEFLLGRISPNGTFAALGYSQVSAPVLIQSASLFGLSAVTFLVCLFASAVAMGLRGGRRGHIAVLIGVSVFALNAAYGGFRLAARDPDTLRVAALADNSDLIGAYDRATAADDLKLALAYADAIRRAAARGAQLAVTAEGGIITSQAWRGAVLSPLAATAKQTQIQIVAGVVQRDPPADMSITIRPDGSMQRYDKRHLVPGLEDSFTAGHSPGLIGDGRATVICKDMDFPTTIRSDGVYGIRIMAVPAGDFGRDGWIHARMAVMRGVENGFAVVRAADDGLLTISDAQGRVIARKNYGESGAYSIVSAVPLGSGPTLYTHIGDAFAWIDLAAAFVLLLLLLLPRVRRQARLVPAEPLGAA